MMANLAAMNEAVCYTYQTNISGNAQVHLGDLYINSNKAEVAGSEQDEAEKEKQEFLRSLSFPQMEYRFHNVGQAIANTCEWLPDLASYKDWENQVEAENGISIFWLKGKPGSGKSTLMKKALSVTRRRLSQASSGAATTIIIDFFFNARGAHLEKSPDGLLRTLLHQLFQQIKEVDPNVIAEFKRKSNTIRTGWEWTEGELRTMFQAAMKKLSAAVVFIFIDALDECEIGSIHTMVQFLTTEVQIPHGSCLKICMSSRHYPNLHVRDCRTVTAEDYNTKDISKFVSTKLQHIDTGDNHLRDRITHGCSGVFLWASLIVKEAQEAIDDGEPQQAVSEILNSVPEHLEDLFMKLISSVSQRERKETSLIILWVLFAKRPLTVRELNFALAFDHPYPSQKCYEDSQNYIAGDRNMEKLLCKRSRGLVEVKKIEGHYDPIVQFIHESVREFLLNERGLQQLDPHLTGNISEVGNDRLARSCFNYLWTDDAMSPVTQPLQYSPVSTWDNPYEELDQSRHFLIYAVRYAFQHAGDADSGQFSQAYIVDEFLRTPEFFDRWLSRHQVFSFNRLMNGIRKRSSPMACLLVFCSHFGIRSCVEKLLHQNFGSKGETSRIYGHALCAATMSGHQQVVTLLLENGADTKFSNENYQSAVCIALSKGIKSIIKVLLEHKADVNGVGDYGSALIHASLMGDEECIEMLLRHGAKVRFVDKDYGHALLAAASAGHSNAVNLLLAAGASIEDTGCFHFGRYARKDTHALEEASYWGHESVVKILLQVAENLQPQWKSKLYESALLVASTERIRMMIQHCLAGERMKTLDLDKVPRTFVQSGLRSAFWRPGADVFSRNEIEVVVITLTRKQLFIKIGRNLQCIDLKQKIRSSEGFPDHDQYLTVNNRFMAEQEYLRDRLIYNAQRVELLLPIWAFRRRAEYR